MQIPSDTEFNSPPIWGAIKEASAFLELPQHLAGWGEPFRNSPQAFFPVLLVPGYRTSNTYLFLLQKFLEHHGFSPFYWSEDYNHGDVEVMLPGLINDLQKAKARYMIKIPVIGWSLGGYLAREAAREFPEAVSRVITLASPIYGGPKYTIVSSVYRSKGYDLDAMEKMINERNSQPIPVPVTAFYSKNDAVIDWKTCIDPHKESVTHFEVNANHLGMIFSLEVFKKILEQLTL